MPQNSGSSRCPGDPKQTHPRIDNADSFTPHHRQLDHLDNRHLMFKIDMTQVRLHPFLAVLLPISGNNCTPACKSDAPNRYSHL